jgi:type IV pilus assembly protein PilV
MQRKIVTNEKGFTLIEALCAMVILSIGIFSFYSLQISSIQGNAKANRITTAATLNAAQIEKMVGMLFSDATLVDTNGNGTGQDTNADGEDNDGGGFGLDDTTGGTTADGSLTTSDGHYILYWNVAADVPMKNLKTIRIHVRDTQQTLSRPVTLTYIKDDII